MPHNFFRPLEKTDRSDRPTTNDLIVVNGLSTPDEVIRRRLHTASAQSGNGEPPIANAQRLAGAAAEGGSLDGRLRRCYADETAPHGLHALADVTC